MLSLPANIDERLVRIAQEGGLAEVGHFTDRLKELLREQDLPDNDWMVRRLFETCISMMQAKSRDTDTKRPSESSGIVTFSTVDGRFA